MLSDFVVLLRVSSHLAMIWGSEMTNIWPDSSFLEKFYDHFSQCFQIINPLNKPAFFVQRSNSIGFDVCD